MTQTTHGELCRACGFCCDGTFFGRGLLEPEEVAVVPSRGLTVVSHAGEPSFPQPCAQHRGERCAIYEARPACCRAYRCRLLERVEAAEVAMADAERHVARVRELASRVRDAIDEERRGEPLFTVAMELATAAKSVAWRRAHAELLLDLGELVHLCRRQFGVRDDGKMHT